jgi:hypothetical protein
MANENEGYQGVVPKSALEDAQGVAKGPQGQPMTREQAQTKKGEILQDKNHAYWNPNVYGDAHERAIQEMFELNKILSPEGDRQSIIESDRGLYDRIKESGFKSPEEIEKLGDEGREKLEIERIDREATQAETQLKVELGDQFAPTINIGKFILDKIFSKKDKDMILERHGNNVDFIKWLGQAGKFFDWGDEAKKYQRKERDENE